MRIPRIYLDQSLDSGNTVQLSTEAHRHVINVLRLREEDKLIIFNAQGREFNAFISKIDKKYTSITIEQPQENNTTSPLDIELGLSLIKSDKLDFAIQKSVELGVTSITPLSADRSTIKLDSKRELKRLAHWQGVIQSACEQSGRNFLPELNALQNISSWLESSNTPGIIFEPRASISLTELSPGKKIRIIIGPEGGFSKNELKEITQHQFKQVKLGPRILRAETAAITAIAALQLLWGDLNS